MNDRTAHQDLLDQVTDSTRERDEVRRILSEPLLACDCGPVRHWECNAGCRADAVNAELRRTLSEPLTEADRAHERWERANTDARNAWPYYSPSKAEAIWPNCCGSCQQGRRACPTPQACQISTEPDLPRPRRKAGDTATIIALLVSTWAAIAFALFYT